MRATKLFLLILIWLPAAAFARDQDWGILQVRTQFAGGYVFMGEVIRRDGGTLYEDRIFDLYRFSAGKKMGRFTVLAGGALVDFGIGNDERRLHQFLIYGLPDWQNISGFVRMGLEERFFAGEPETHWRARLRLQAHPLSHLPAGPAFYNEAFWTPDGHGKFANGHNENRFGAGFRVTAKPLDVYLFYVWAKLEGLSRTSYPQWGQLQITFDF
jgi:hypothetical protein